MHTISRRAAISRRSDKVAGYSQFLPYWTTRYIPRDAERPRGNQLWTIGGGRWFPCGGNRPFHGGTTRRGDKFDCECKIWSFRQSVFEILVYEYVCTKGYLVFGRFGECTENTHSVSALFMWWYFVKTEDFHRIRTFCFPRSSLQVWI